MLRRGNCCNNAPLESFYGHIKDEIDVSHCKNFRKVKAIIGDWMDYYNNERYQWQLDSIMAIYPLEEIVNRRKDEHSVPIKNVLDKGHNLQI